MTTRITRLVDRIRVVFWKVLLTDQVQPLIWIFYFPLLAWGVYGTFFAAPATYVQPVMGNIVYDLWVWSHIAGTLTVMCGLWIEGRSSSPKKLKRIGLQFQASGHACMFLLLLGYEVSAIYTVHWGQGTYSILVVSPYVAGCLLLAARGLAQLIVGEHE
jgi:hypothetical protein